MWTVRNVGCKGINHHVWRAWAAGHGRGRWEATSAGLPRAVHDAWPHGPEAFCRLDERDDAIPTVPMDFRVVGTEAAGEVETPIWILADPRQSLSTALGVDMSRRGPGPAWSQVLSGDLQDHVWRIDNALSVQECQHFIKAACVLGYHDVTSASPQFTGLPRVKNANFILPELADILYQRLEGCLPKDFLGNKAVGINALMRSFQYSTGGEFVPHYDSEKPQTTLARNESGGMQVIENNDVVSKFTLLLYLNDDFLGGTTRLFETSSGKAPYQYVDFQTGAGGALLFPQGSHPLSLRHAGTPVTHGIKHIISTQVLYPKHHLDSPASSSATTNRSLSLAAKAYHPQWVKVIECGKNIDLSFFDGVTYRFRASWLNDCALSNWDHDHNRIYNTQQRAEARIKSAELSDNGCLLRLKWEGAVGGSREAHRDEFLVAFLRASAPASAQLQSVAAHQPHPTARVLMAPEDCRPWSRRSEAEFKQHTFEYKSLAESDTLQLELLRKLYEPGYAIVNGLPDVSESDLAAGDNPVFSQVISELVAPFETQRQQKHFYHTIVSLSDDEKLTSVEFDDRRALKMHTDRSSHGIDGSLIAAFHLSRGCAVMRLVDGLSVSEHLKQHHPKHWHCLVNTPISHGFMNHQYSEDGGVRDISNPENSMSEFCLYGQVPGHIEVDSNGNFKRMTISERKRGMLEADYEQQDLYFESSELLTATIESADFDIRAKMKPGTMILVNNHMVLHGRGDILERPRVLSGGYLMRPMVESQLRLLTGRAISEAMAGELDRAGVEVLLSRFSNGVLARLFADRRALRELRAFRGTR